MTMSFTSIGDLSQSLMTTRQNSLLKTQLTRLTQELASGQAADLSAHLSGNLSDLSDIEHQITVNNALANVSKEAGFATEAMQTAMETIRDEVSTLASAAALINDSAGPQQRAAVTSLAEGVLDAVTSALNIDVAGRPLFAGTDVSGPALAGADDVLIAARAATSGVTGPASLNAAMDAFFAPGGAYETLVYTGGTTDMSPFELGAGQSIALDLRADSDVFRDALRDTITLVVAGDAALPLTEGERADLMSNAGARLFGVEAAVAGAQADLGYAQSRIDAASSRIAAEQTSLGLARNDLLAVDPFNTATELENVQFQLEMLYTVTARSARLNLMNFLS